MAEQVNKHQEQAFAAPQSQSAAAPQPQQPVQQQQARPCPKDCSKCGFQQHAFCAAKMSFDAFTVMSAILQKLDAQAAVIADMAVRLKAIESAEAELAAPAPVQGDLFDH